MGRTRGRDRGRTREGWGRMGARDRGRIRARNRGEREQGIGGE